MTDFAEARPLVRAALETTGVPVLINEHEREQYPDSPTFWTSVYGWEDSAVKRHVRPYDGSEGCAFVVPEGAELTEVSYSLFTDTYSDNELEIGINAYGGPEDSPTTIACRCGLYRGLTLRLQGSLGEVLQAVLTAPLTL